MMRKKELSDAEIIEKNIDKTPKSDIIFKILFGAQKAS